MRVRCFMVEWDESSGYFRHATDSSPVILNGNVLPSRSKLDLPFGAMWFCDSLNVAPGRSNPCLFVNCGPTRTGALCVWNIDGQAYGPHGPAGERGYYGAGWTRTGTPPAITATPSIEFPGEFHGWLRDGWLEE